MNRFNRYLRTAFSRQPLAMLVGVMLLGSSGLAAGHNPYQRVLGEFEVFFTQFDVRGQTDTHEYVNVELDGTFQLDAGGQPREGRVLYPHILKKPLGPGIPGSLFGASLWIFDADGVICTGYQGVRDGGFPIVTSTRLDCSDGTRLYLKVGDEVVIPEVSVSGTIKGVWRKHPPRRNHHD